jgi:hypothetical protein
MRLKSPGDSRLVPIVRWSLALALLPLLAIAPARAVEDAAAPADTKGACYTFIRDDATPETVCITENDFYKDVCRAIAVSAANWQIPEDYFARLIWQESRFNPNAQSGAGAEGIAQFMPSTGRLRGVHDAFNPAEALVKSAEYLRFLVDKFGNLGLAAAAYNGGENRMTRYVASRGLLPFETRYYVEIVTGRTVDAWLDEAEISADYALAKDVPFHDACVQMAEGRAIPSLQPPLGETLPWGVMLAQDFSQAVAVRSFERLQKQYGSVIGNEQIMLARGRNPNFGPRLRYFAMIGRNTRDEAEALCRDLRRAGGACIVRKN